jgi:hypothetical protein
MKEQDLIEGLKKFLDGVLDPLSDAESLILRFKAENSL